MSAFSPMRRAEVAMRAGHRCEYCHLPTRGQVATFPIDHIVPRIGGAGNDPDNLAFACPHCNARKWTAVDGVDPVTALRVQLFNPRTEEWDAHFEWIGGGALAGRTPTGRATVVGLGMNDASMVELRRLLAELTLFPEAG